MKNKLMPSTILVLDSKIEDPVKRYDLTLKAEIVILNHDGCTYIIKNRYGNTGAIYKKLPVIVERILKFFNLL
jgi:hypothetical protein